MAAVKNVLWNNNTGVWLDYNVLRQRHNTAFYPSNLMPLWADCGVEPAAAERVLQYLKVSQPARPKSVAEDAGKRHAKAQYMTCKLMSTIVRLRHKRATRGRP